MCPSRKPFWRFFIHFDFTYQQRQFANSTSPWDRREKSKTRRGEHKKNSVKNSGTFREAFAPDLATETPASAHENRSSSPPGRPFSSEFFPSPAEWFRAAKVCENDENLRKHYYLPVGGFKPPPVHMIIAVRFILIYHFYDFS